MKNIILKVSLLLVLSTSLFGCNLGDGTGFKTPLATTSHKLNIQNGTAVTDPSLNGMIPLVYIASSKSICTGTLLSQDIVLTAAHCVMNMRPKELNEPYSEKEVVAPQNVFLILSKNLNRPVNGARFESWNIYQVEKIYAHKDAYKGAEVWLNESNINLLKIYDIDQINDVAILKLNRPVDSQYKFAKLAMENPRIKTKVVIAGYGYNDIPPLNGTVEVLNAAISEVYEVYPSGSSIKVGGTIESQIGYTKTCQGDSGGPDLIYNAVTNQYIITGIHSFGYGAFCGYSSVPSTSMSVAYYLEWIESGYLINHL